jgi:hypothetical protein
MTNLSINWFYQGTPDFEYKKYLLLAYLQYVKRHFGDTKLYPCLAELVAHYRSLHEFVHHKKSLDHRLPKDLEGIDLKRFRLIYKAVAKNDRVLDTIEKLVEYALPRIKSQIENGKDIYDFIEDQLRLYPVGLLPLHKDEGYVILAGYRKDYLVYNYTMSVFSTPTDNYRSLHTKYLLSYKRSIINTLPNIKAQLINKFRSMPNPATYVVESEINVPIRETLLPIAKKMLVAHLMK